MRRDHKKLTMSTEQLSQAFSSMTVENLISTKSLALDRYKYLLSVAPLYMKEEQLWELLLSIIKHDKSSRLKEEIEVIVQMTSQLKFFQQLNSKQRNIENNVHQKVSANLEHEFFPQGSIIFKQDSPPERFYIILRGSVNIYLRKEEQQIEAQYQAEKNGALKSRNLIHVLESIKTFQKQNNITEARLRDSPNLINRSSPKRKTMSPVKQGLSLIPPSLDSSIKNDESYKIIMQQTGNILPESLVEMDFYFNSKGIFRHRYITSLPAGSMFGELGILLQKGRSASVVAQTDTDLAVLSAQFYRNLLRDIDLKKVQARVEFFNKYFFHSMPLNLIMKYSYNFETRKIVRGDYLYRQSDTAGHVFIIKKGEIMVVVENGQKYEISQMGEGQIFGDVEIIKDIPRTHSAICSSHKGKVHFLEAEIFQRLLKDNVNMKIMFEKSVKIKSNYEKDRLDFLKKNYAKSDHIKAQSVDITDPQSARIVKESNSQLFERIKTSVENKKLILRHKGGFVPMGKNLSHIPKELMEMRQSLVQISMSGRFEHLTKDNSFYKIPMDVKKKLKNQKSFMDRFREAYNKDNPKPDKFIKNIDDFKSKVLLRTLSQKEASTVPMSQRDSMVQQPTLVQNLSDNFTGSFFENQIKNSIQYKPISQQTGTRASLTTRETRTRPDTRQRDIRIQSTEQMTIMSSPSIRQRSGRSGSGTLIPSKHNLFRLKPDRQYVIDQHYKSSGQ